MVDVPPTVLGRSHSELAASLRSLEAPGLRRPRREECASLITREQTLTIASCSLLTSVCEVDTTRGQSEELQTRHRPTCRRRRNTPRTNLLSAETSRNPLPVLGCLNVHSDHRAPLRPIPKYKVRERVSSDGPTLPTPHRDSSRRKAEARSVLVLANAARHPAIWPAILALRSGSLDGH